MMLNTKRRSLDGLMRLCRNMSLSMTEKILEEIKGYPVETRVVKSMDCYGIF